MEDGMSAPDYLSRIEEVATGGRSVVGPPWERLKREWQSLELELAGQVRPYDVFTPGELVRTRIRSLIALMYEFNLGTPEEDVAQLREKDAAYGGSWHARGGVGAFFVTVRKMDRLLNIVDRKYAGVWQTALSGEAGGSEGLEDTLGDLRRYLILIEAWHVARGTMSAADVGQMITEQSGRLVPRDTKREDQMCADCNHPRSVHHKLRCEHSMPHLGVAHSCPCTGFSPQKINAG
jgi:hypothetical protein